MSLTGYSVTISIHILSVQTPTHTNERLGARPRAAVTCLNCRQKLAARTSKALAPVIRARLWVWGLVYEKTGHRKIGRRRIMPKISLAVCQGAEKGVWKLHVAYNAPAVRAFCSAIRIAICMATPPREPHPRATPPP